ncbi:isoleucine--tRNA ligase [candidate division WOR-1 bacterium RIFOXYA12_FULL_43_27]|uniref:Isoleucine--tRNA ligase n=1 Tax=candidate division WOR-1 bacterium RIFOXYC2_FULL_46_14 TaxID=1802587 RepID=A0A1F4U8D3_UNCSA|nr:MAG: isoleucine--tRNA ligase [candidate division WOR-1 bacterium RIFOXYA12_FULL_43_27]OGC19487.1 MAG: isoleucine--tRNA ligase [candidate division WOR-1 bacterium RIFOXYB2_FULL_46_45]OGC30475.1 MAG: isoleucine--tRNA ligase [candidate division WOR-1 bacterium RIFOXYA2_FULL_46_56]OGC40543.1 MAG: isoleucine--tRNA ligase [candidate division WOR-1 bacterium RIFOXYC2_FULL_46_14]
MEYKQTLNLPKTDLPIRANLQVVEEECLKKWEEENTYRKLEDKNKDKGHAKYILHDGPPYPNGDIHLGHALNKVLKDIIIKYKLMRGFHAPFVPGWDCHGLPIETQLIKKLGDKRKELGILEFRKQCREYALGYVELQKKEFVRLGCFGEWDNPYLTLNHDYEEKIAEVFGTLSEKGYIYRGLKPIHWCPSCETALAEAELEYEDDKSPSIYVKFKVTNPLERRSFVIWTTTPWTLPANVAVAVHPDFEYVFLKVKDETYVIAEGLLENFVAKAGIPEYEIVGKTRGKNLEGTILKHPFLDREVPVILGEIVTLEQGTGCVHIAPGHGQEDYLLGLKYKLPIIMPVNEKGVLDDTTGPGAGLYYDKANKAITEYMQQNGSLLHLEFFKHSYPHCWRCKKPVIFRATEQWFVAVDHNDLRKKALQAIKETKWYPSWGENRITGMVEGRPDWCISRQRSWGVPIPAFYCENCGEVNTTGEFNKAAQELFKKEGSDAWFKYDASDILPKGTKCQKCNGTNFKKETDILDVWFESGSSHAAVLDGIANLYLEGSDQHRGWFQTSLLTAVGTKGRAPFNAVLTHGFTIDDKGKKMSKSLGNVVNPQEVVKKYGADVLRLWVASTDFRNDMAASDNILKQVQDAYLKIRNTCRFLVSNLYDFDKPVEYRDLLEIDKWILLRLNKLIEKVTKAYDEFEFHLVYHSVYEFCVKDLSALYLDILKDRLYCEKADSPARRSGQTALAEILAALIKMLAPVLSFTSENIAKYCGGQGSIFESGFPHTNPKYYDQKLEEKWEIVLTARENVYKKIEELRDKKEIKSSSQATATIYAKGEELAALKSQEFELSTIFMVSEVFLKEGENHLEVVPSTQPKCERCWRLLPITAAGICKRCSEAI